MSVCVCGEWVLCLKINGNNRFLGLGCAHAGLNSVKVTQAEKLYLSWGGKIFLGSDISVCFPVWLHADLIWCNFYLLVRSCCFVERSPHCVSFKTAPVWVCSAGSRGAFQRGQSAQVHKLWICLQRQLVHHLRVRGRCTTGDNTSKVNIFKYLLDFFFHSEMKVGVLNSYRVCIQTERGFAGSVWIYGGAM